MNARLTYTKALYLIRTGKADEGEPLLRQALGEAAAEGDAEGRAQVWCRLGQLLHEQGRNDEAERTLSEFLASDCADAAPREQRRAEELLEGIRRG